MNTEAAPPLEAAAAQRARLRWILIGAGTGVLLLVALVMYALSGRYMSTDDASIKAAQTGISANISGRIVSLSVLDNQRVHRGDVLFQIDDRPLRIAVNSAAAKLALIRLQISAAKANYRHQLAQAEAARNTLEFELHELERQTRLNASGITSRVQLEQTQHAADLARRELASAEQTAASVLAFLDGNPQLPLDNHPAVMEAHAALDRANLDLSYATITAPDDGVVTKVEQLHVGSFINAAVEVFTLVSSRDVWIEANFKEDQLAHMQPGQSADVTIDSYPDRSFKAKVISLSPGTGSQFSVLPAENATGNWVKVVQRVPVRLAFLNLTPEMASAMHTGLSATVSVDTHHHNGLFASAR